MAIAYDFDGTLAPGNMQQHSFIPKLGIDNKSFWEEANKIARDNDMSEILAYMYLMIRKANEKEIPITQDAFIEYGKGLKLYPGVNKYFSKINQYAESKNIELQHFIISSGLLDILKGTDIFHEFKKVFASSFKYNVNNVAEWPAIAIDYTNKTQFLFRINKGINNSWDNEKINRYVPDSERPIPFKRMVYIGDGETDIPAMKMIMYQGGKAIVVYNPDQNSAEGNKAKMRSQEIVLHGRANYIAPADYSEKSDLFKIIKLCVDKVATEYDLDNFANVKTSNS